MSPSPTELKIEVKDAAQLAELARHLGLPDAEPDHVLAHIALQVDRRREWLLNPDTTLPELARYLDQNDDPFLVDSLFRSRTMFLPQLETFLATGEPGLDISPERLDSLFRIHDLDLAKQLCAEDPRYFSHCSDQLRSLPEFFIFAWDHRENGALADVNRVTAYNQAVFEHFLAHAHFPEQENPSVSTQITVVLS